MPTIQFHYYILSISASIITCLKDYHSNNLLSLSDKCLFLVNLLFKKLQSNWQWVSSLKFIYHPFRIGTQTRGNNQTPDKRVTMISIGIVVMFFICHLPRVCMMTFELINAEALTGHYRISKVCFFKKVPYLTN